MISAEEKEPELQKLHIPMESADNESWNKLPGEPNEPLPPVSKVMMSYPLGKPSLSLEVIDVEGKQPIDYYIDLAKEQPGKKLAFISRKQRLLIWE